MRPNAVVYRPPQQQQQLAYTMTSPMPPRTATFSGGAMTVRDAATLPQTPRTYEYNARMTAMPHFRTPGSYAPAPPTTMVPTSIRPSGSLIEHVQQSAYSIAQNQAKQASIAEAEAGVESAEKTASVLEARARRFEAAAGELREAAALKGSAQRETAERQAHVRAMRDKVKALDDANKQRLADVRAIERRVQADKTRREAALARARTRSIALVRATDAKVKAAEAVSAEITILTAQLEDLTLAADTTRARVTKAADILSAEQARMAELTAESETTKESNAALESAITEKSAAIAVQQGAYDDMTARHASLVNTLANVKKNRDAFSVYSQGDYARLTAQIAEAEAAIEAATKKAEVSGDALKSAMDTRQTAEDAAARLKKDIEEARSQATKTKRETDAIKGTDGIKTVAEATSLEAAAEKQVTEARAALAAAQKSRTQAATLVRRLAAATKEHAAKMVVLTAARERAATEAANAADARAIVQGKLDAAKEAKAGAIARRSAAVAALAALANAKITDGEEITEADVAAIAARVEEARGRVNAAQMRKGTLLQTRSTLEKRAAATAAFMAAMKEQDTKRAAELDKKSSAIKRIKDEIAAALDVVTKRIATARGEEEAAAAAKNEELSRTAAVEAAVKAAEAAAQKEGDERHARENEAAAKQEREREARAAREASAREAQERSAKAARDAAAAAAAAAEKEAEERGKLREQRAREEERARNAERMHAEERARVQAAARSAVPSFVQSSSLLGDGFSSDDEVDASELLARLGAAPATVSQAARHSHHSGVRSVRMSQQAPVINRGGRPSILESPARPSKHSSYTVASQRNGKENNSLDDDIIDDTQDSYDFPSNNAVSYTLPQPRPAAATHRPAASGITSTPIRRLPTVGSRLPSAAPPSSAAGSVYDFTPQLKPIAPASRTATHTAAGASKSVAHALAPIPRPAPVTPHRTAGGSSAVSSAIRRPAVAMPRADVKRKKDAPAKGSSGGGQLPDVFDFMTSNAF